MTEKTLTLNGPKETETTTEEKTPRRKRVPLGVRKSRLTAPEREGMHRRWMNEQGTRLQDAQDAGYTFVDDDVDGEGTGTRVHRTVDKTTGQQAYLMELPQELYDEDQAVKQRENDTTDEAIKTGNIKGEVGADGKYVPKDGIKIGTH